MGLVKVITKLELSKAKKDLNFREELRQDAIRAEINALLARGEKIFSYTERRDITEEDITMILREYKKFKPKAKAYRQPGEDLAEVHFNY